MTYIPFKGVKKLWIAVTTAFFLFLWSMNPVSGANQNVTCTNSGCSGFSSPLFSDTGAVPGDSVSKTFSIKNEKSETLSLALLSSKDAGTDDSFLKEISVVIYKNSSDIVFSGNMENFLTGGSLTLGTVDPGNTQLYEIQLALSKDAGNQFQGSEVHFSLSLNITGEETQEGQVLGTSTSSDGGSSNSENTSNTSNTNNLIGQVLGLSDTSGEIYKILFLIVGFLLLANGVKIIIKRTQK